ncbi:hypothetical protein KM043_011755 [Ampulex compressa]|nr:hypothetical protein KM043_011755 [Ampulex compressa]
MIFKLRLKTRRKFLKFVCRGLNVLTGISENSLVSLKEKREIFECSSKKIKAQLPFLSIEIFQDPADRTLDRNSQRSVHLAPPGMFQPLQRAAPPPPFNALAYLREAEKRLVRNCGNTDAGCTMAGSIPRTSLNTGYRCSTA